MRKSILSEGHKAQVCGWLAEGKKTKEIIADLKTQYGLVVPAYVVYGLNNRLPREAKEKRTYTKRPYRKTAKRSKKVEEIVLPEDVLPCVKPIIEEIRRNREVFVNTLKFIRLELIKSRAEVLDLKDTSEYIKNL